MAGGYAIIWRKARGAGMGTEYHRTQAAALKRARAIGRGLGGSSYAAGPSSIRATLYVERRGRRRLVAQYGPKGGAPHNILVAPVSHDWRKPRPPTNYRRKRRRR